MSQASASVSSSTASSAVDRVTLSPEATAPGGGDTATSGVTTEAPVSPVSPVAKNDTERRADALFGALDADQDGAITEQEFTSGAAALLRRAGDRHRTHGHGDDARSERGEERRASRLERKLERVFGRVDGNGDGSIDKEELTSALAAAAARRQGADPARLGEPATPPAAPAPAAPPSEPPVSTAGGPAGPPVQTPPSAPRQLGAPAGSGSGVASFSFSVSVVSIAVQRYTSLAA